MLTVSTDVRERPSYTKSHLFPSRLGRLPRLSQKTLILTTTAAQLQTEEWKSKTDNPLWSTVELNFRLSVKQKRVQNEKLSSITEVGSVFAHKLEYLYVRYPHDLMPYNITVRILMVCVVWK